MGMPDPAGGVAGTSLVLAGVTKHFGPVAACSDISLTVEPGEVRGLLGQNGAGKSTLMRIISGIERPDHGSVAVSGAVLPPGDPLAARAAGVAMVHQHLSLVGPLTVWENVVLGQADAVDRRRIARRVEEVGGRYGLEVDPFARVEDLTPGQRQRVEIVKCLWREPKVIILDEPTSILTAAESRRLFQVLHGLVEERGAAVLLVSHRLSEILEATHRVTVLRDGMLVTTHATADTDVAQLAREMLGHTASVETEGTALGIGDTAHASTAAVVGEPHPTSVAPVAVADPAVDPAVAEVAPALELRGVTVRDPDGRLLLDEVSLQVRPGEIVGLAGVEGNGQRTLVELLSNAVRPDQGTVVVAGRKVRPGGRRPLHGVGVIPSDRHDAGCVLKLSVAENLVLGRLDELRRHGLLSRRLVRAEANRLVAEYDVVTAGADAPMWALSGGNQQRVILARELSSNPSVLVASQPTYGLDVGAMADMWQRLRAAAAAGTGVLLVSTELDEILSLASRVLVMHRGAVVGEMPATDADPERLGLLMGGVAA
jgi:simple sugar transport system ATP-binding protein